MKTQTKNCIIVIIVIQLLATPAIVSCTSSSKSSDLSQTTDFLSSVLGLDLTKYTLVVRNVTVPPDWPKPLFNDVDFRGPSYTFKYNNNSLQVMSIFYGEHLTAMTIDSKQDYLYADSPPNDVLNQANAILEKYQSFLSQKSTADNSFLVPMQNILSNVKDLSVRNDTIGNISFQLTKNGKITRLQWIYTEDGIIMNRKRVEMEFEENTLVSFSDRWSLYKVSGLDVLSAKDALNLALEAAQKVEFQMVNADGTNSTVKVPDLSNAHYDIFFSMLPYEGDDPGFPSQVTRDALTLYPLWQFRFYLNESIGGIIAVQVGIWGDTKDIFYASGFGYLGDPGVYRVSGAKQVTDLEQKQTTVNPLITATAIVAVILALSIPIAIRRRHQPKV